MKKQKQDAEPAPQEMEEFWLELGPAEAYEGMECHDAAVKNGDASPDGKRLGWPGAQPGAQVAPDAEAAIETAAASGVLPQGLPGDLLWPLPLPPQPRPELELDPELHALEWLDDVPPIDR